MKDIRAMKERFEEELKLAELGNNIEEVLIEYGIKVGVSKYKTVNVSVYNEGENIITKDQLSNLLKVFPPKNLIGVWNGSKYIYMTYHLGTYRGYRDMFSTLEIKYCAGDFNVWCSLKIDAELDKFFTTELRNIDSSEASTYLGGASTQKLNKIRIERKVFKDSGCVRFVGGRVSCLSEDVIEHIINELTKTN